MATTGDTVVHIASSESSFSLSHDTNPTGFSPMSSSPGLDNPAVIVGLACRVAGASTSSQLWEKLVAQKDVQTKMPTDRFNVDAYFHSKGANKGTTSATHGYFLDQDLGVFDAPFFHISGKEAEAMDPQQRLLLEVVYEALEDAGITMDEISGSQTSVFCGSFSTDYELMLVKDPLFTPKYAVTGTGNALLANRISYFYNLHGISVTMDSACSSSLLGFHMGVQSLETCEMAIIVGSALHFEPYYFLAMSELGMLDKDGRSMTFDARGTGYARGEAVCAVVLKKQQQALTHGDRIRSVILATGSNHDGAKEGTGITVPSSVGQANLIRRTYSSHGLDPADTGYVEAHGTGTSRGDPVEMAALGAVFGPSRLESEPLYVGSIKPNIGHTEGAAGLMGVIKATLALEHGQIPPNMHFKIPHPEIQFKEWRLRVPLETVEFPTNRFGVRRASVNSFGYGGSNAHAVLESYLGPEAIQTPPTPLLDNSIEAMTQDRPFIIPLSSHSQRAGDLLVERLNRYIQQHPGQDIADISRTLASRRSIHEQRSYTICNRSSTNLIHIPWVSASGSKPTRLGFVFTGQGAQWHTMGRQLIQQSPQFQQTLDRCDGTLQLLPERPNWSIKEVLLEDIESGRLQHAQFSQPICTALQMAIVDVLWSWGIQPSTVVGHSSGEIAAAYAAKILSFESAIITAFYRGLHMSNNHDDSAVRGAMMAVGVGEREALAKLDPYQGQLCIAAVNSPSSVTVSGDEPAIMQLKETLDAQNVFARQLKVTQAFHSHHMLPLAPAYHAALKNCQAFSCMKGEARMFSSVTARLANGSCMGPGYWTANMTQPVRFADALTGVVLDEEEEQNVDILIEIGPHPALRSPCQEVLKTLKLENIPYLGSLTRDMPAYNALLTLAGKLFQLGYPTNLDAVNSDFLQSGESGLVSNLVHGKRVYDLPSYAWDHGRRYWSETRAIRNNRLRKNRHSLLGVRIPTSSDTHPSWRNFLRLSELSWLADHAIDGTVIFPAGAYISMAVEAVTSIRTDLDESTTLTLREIDVKSALVLDDSEMGVEVSLELRSSGGWYEFTLISYDSTTGQCTEHCTGQMSVSEPVNRLETVPHDLTSLTNLLKITTSRVSASALYEHLSQIGLLYGPGFQLMIGDIETGPRLALATLVFEPNRYGCDMSDITFAHTVLLDALNHPGLVVIPHVLGRPLNGPWMASFVECIQISASIAIFRSRVGPQELSLRLFLRKVGHREAVTDIVLCQSGSDEPLITVRGYKAVSLDGDSFTSPGPGRSLFFRTHWRPAFDTLTTGVPVLQGKGLAYILDLFVHQHPNTSILHFTSGVEQLLMVLTYLGGTKTQRRRVKSVIPIFSNGIDDETALLTVMDERPGMIHTLPQAEGSFDLVISTGNAPSPDIIQSYLKDGGYAITDDGNFQAKHSLTQLFIAGSISAWVKQAELCANQATTALTLVLPSNPTPNVLGLASRIQLDSGVSLVSTVCLDKPLPTDEWYDDVLVLASLGENDIFFVDDADVNHEKHQLPEETFQTVQRLLIRPKINLVWLLCGATMESRNPSQAIIVGLCRVARSEISDSRIATLDLPTDWDHESAAGNALRVLGSYKEEDEFSLRDGHLWIPRVEPDDELNSKLPNGVTARPLMEPLSPSRLVKLSKRSNGQKSLIFEDDHDESLKLELAADEVEISVKAFGISTDDVINLMGDVDEQDSASIGECAGEVIRVGAGVNALQPGDRIVTLTNSCVQRSVIRTHGALCSKIGNLMSFDQAASLPLTLVTVYYALIKVARVQAGEWVLILSAADDSMGQMAIQLCQMVGASVMMISLSENDRELLASCHGISPDHILSELCSDQVMNVTQCRGLDVVLLLEGACASADIIRKATTCRGVCPRFLTVSSTRGDPGISAFDFLPGNAIFAAVDIPTLLHESQTMVATLLQDAMGLVYEGKIQPGERMRSFSFSAVDDVLRFLQESTSHRQRVVMAYQENERLPIQPSQYQGTQQLFHPDKVYLLVGGLGGIGRALAEWLFQLGARELAFFSRSGAKTKDARKTVQWLQSHGVKVEVYTGDVSSAQDTEACLRSLPNLAGIFQAAMVLRDSPLENMTTNQWNEVLQPKVQGTCNLHRLTLQLNQCLDFFICFSSTSPILGSRAQANYSAANAYMDALMRYRRGLGLPGTTMNCGRISGVGVVAEDAAMGAIMDQLGYETVSREELFYQIEEAITCDPLELANPRGYDAHQIITGVPMSRKDYFWSAKPLFRNLYSNHDFFLEDQSKQQEMETGPEGVMSQVQQASSLDEKANFLLKAVINKVSELLAVPTDIIQSRNPLSIYGLDSVVAIDVRNWFSRSLGISMPLFEILGAPSISSLVEKALNLLLQAGNATVVKGTSTGAVEGDIQQEKTPGLNSSSEFEAVDLSSPLPMSTFQRRLWFAHHFSMDKTIMNLFTSIRMKGSPDRAVLQQALHELRRRNHALRTCYRENDQLMGEQTVTDQYETILHFEDHSAASDKSDALDRLFARLRATPLEVEQGQPLEMTLVHQGADDFILLCVIHHIAIDRGSARSLLTQLITLYDAISSGADLSTVPHPKVSYPEFTVWHNKQISSPETIEPHLQFWRKELADMPTCCKLLPFAKFERSSQPDDNSERGIATGLLKPALVSRMKRISSHCGANPFHFVLAAFRAFLFRYTEEDDLAIAISDGNRAHADLSDVIGFFVNLVPIRCRDDCDRSTFEELLKTMCGRVLEFMPHGILPFEMIVHATQAKRTTQHLPLTQISFTYQVADITTKYQSRDFAMHDLEIQDVRTIYELHLDAMEDSAHGMKFQLQYSLGLYDEHHMSLFMDNFITFLANVVRDHRQPIQEVALCGPKEMALLQSRFWNGTTTATNPWREENALQRILAVGKRNPHCIAIHTSEGATITYGDLLDRVQRVQQVLHSVHLPPGSFVAVLADPGIDCIVAILGILMNKCAYVPLDSKMAPNRLAFMMIDSGSRVLLYHHETAALANDLYVQSRADWNLMSINDACTQSTHPGMPETVNITDSEPAYMIYTSGSTGHPKAVVLSHLNLQAILSHADELFHFSAKDRWLHQLSIGFDASILEIFPALTAGGRLCIATRQIRDDPRLIARFMRDQSITVSPSVPTKLALLLEHGREDLLACQGCRLIFTGGERLPTRLVEDFYSLKIPATLVNLYGPTETALAVSSYHVPRQLETPVGTNIPIGRPIGNCRLYVVDSLLNPLPVGFVGEVCIGGPQVSAQGYRNRPDLDWKFPQNPFCLESDRMRGWDRLFLTGDRGRFLPDGRVECMGRIEGDTQEKLRGYRLDLGEIENVLARESITEQVHGITAVAVLPRKIQGSSDGLQETSGIDDRQLVAFLVTNPPLQSAVERSAYAATLQSRARAHLNYYMLPAAYQFLDTIPLTMSGKIDRQDLMRRSLQLVYATTASVDQQPPQLHLGTSCCSSDSILPEVLMLFQGTLGLEGHINDTDDFFTLGGQSISLLRLQASIRKAFNITLGLKDLFAAATPAATAQLIARNIDHNTASASGETRIDWDEECRLPSSNRYSVPERMPRISRSEVTSILLTGAESFAGIHMLAHLLVHSPHITVHVLGTSAPLQHSHLFTRLVENKLMGATLTAEMLLTRVHCVSGALIQPGLGLDEPSFRSLANAVHSIYHFGTEISLLKGYRDLKAANVRPVLELIELSRTGQHLSEIHAMSTWSVLHLQSWTTSQRTKPDVQVDEQPVTHFFPSSDNSHGYFKTRWVAEVLLTKASERGFPVSIYRSSTLSGSTVTGVPSARDDIVRAMILDMVQLRLVPELPPFEPEYSIDFIPVDHLVTTVYNLSTLPIQEIPISEPQIFHIRNPQPLPLAQLPTLIGEIRDDRRTGSVVSIAEWLETLARDATAQQQLRVETFREYFRLNHTMFSMSCSRTTEALSAHDCLTQCPALDTAYLRRMWLNHYAS